MSLLELSSRMYFGWYFCFYVLMVAVPADWVESVFVMKVMAMELMERIHLEPWMIYEVDVMELFLAEAVVEAVVPNEHSRRQQMVRFFALIEAWLMG